MADLRRVTECFSVAPQIQVEDIAEIIDQGFTVVVNNRPDGEAPDQPPSDAFLAECSARRLVYYHIPISGVPTARDANAIREILDSGGIVLSFCRSGTRSINAWALGEALDGAPKDL